METITLKKNTERTNIVAISVYKDLGPELVKLVCGECIDDKGNTKIADMEVEMTALSGDLRINPESSNVLDTADGIVLIVRFLDVISIDKIKAVYRRLPSEVETPVAVFVFREEGEVDFKMSCPACGQKIWVRDQDIGKRGRCPNCRKAFCLPSQTAQLKSQLMLTESIPVLNVVEGNTSSCRGAITVLVDLIKEATQTAVNQEALKNATVRIQV